MCRGLGKDGSRNCRGGRSRGPLTLLGSLLTWLQKFLFRLCSIQACWHCVFLAAPKILGGARWRKERKPRNGSFQALTADLLFLSQLCRRKCIFGVGRRIFCLLPLLPRGFGGRWAWRLSGCAHGKGKRLLRDHSFGKSKHTVRRVWRIGLGAYRCKRLLKALTAVARHRVGFRCGSAIQLKPRGVRWRTQSLRFS